MCEHIRTNTTTQMAFTRPQALPGLPARPPACLPAWFLIMSMAALARQNGSRLPRLHSPSHTQHMHLHSVNRLSNTLHAKNLLVLTARIIKNKKKLYKAVFTCVYEIIINQYIIYRRYSFMKCVVCVCADLQPVSVLAVIRLPYMATQVYCYQHQ